MSWTAQIGIVLIVFIGGMNAGVHFRNHFLEKHKRPFCSEFVTQSLLGCEAVASQCSDDEQYWHGLKNMFEKALFECREEKNEEDIPGE